MDRVDHAGDDGDSPPSDEASSGGGSALRKALRDIAPYLDLGWRNVSERFPQRRPTPRRGFVGGRGVPVVPCMIYAIHDRSSLWLHRVVSGRPPPGRGVPVCGLHFSDLLRRLSLVCFARLWTRFPILSSFLAGGAHTLENRRAHLTFPRELGPVFDD